MEEDAGSIDDAGRVDAGLSVDAGPQDAGPPVLSFTGPATGSNDAVGIVTWGQGIALYACGGPSSYATESNWFTGQLEANGSFSLNTGYWTATGTVTASGATGQLSGPNATVIPFDLPPVDPPTGAGVYEAAATGGCLTGVVVWGSAAGVQVQGTWCDNQGNFDQVIPVTPVADLGFQVRNVPLTVTPPLTFWVRPAVEIIGGILPPNY
jgi:hypothetical protein